MAVARGRTRHGTEAEDVYQETCLRAWRDLRSLGEPARFVPWACAIAGHVAGDGARRNRVRAAEPLRETPAPPRPLGEPRRRAVLDAVGALPEALREVVELFYFARLTYREIADAIGRSVPTVNLRLAEARGKLRERLKDEHE